MSGAHVRVRAASDRGSVLQRGISDGAGSVVVRILALRSDHMLPISARDDAADGGLLDDKSCCQSVLWPLAGRIQRANFSHGVRCQCRTAVAFSMPSAALVGHVSLIVSGSSQEQMTRTYAAAVIAGVTDQEARRDRAMQQFPGHAVCADGGFREVQTSIAEHAVAAGPLPTPCCCFSYACKEQCAQTFGGLCRFHMEMAVNHRQGGDVNVALR